MISQISLSKSKALSDKMISRFQQLVLDKRGIKLPFDQARIEAEKFTYDAIFLLKQLQVLEKNWQ